MKSQIGRIFDYLFVGIMILTTLIIIGSMLAGGTQSAMGVIRFGVVISIPVGLVSVALAQKEG